MVKKKSLQWQNIDSDAKSTELEGFLKYSVIYYVFKYLTNAIKSLEFEFLELE